jgi:transcriptional regulator with XRE-family HTH domain
LGESVRQLRVLQGLSQEELAERAGLHWTQVQRIEQAKLNPTLETLESLARGLGVPAAKLLDGTTDEKSSTLEALLGLLAGCTEREANLVLQMTKCILSSLPELNNRNEGSR